MGLSPLPRRPRARRIWDRAACNLQPRTPAATPGAPTIASFRGIATIRGRWTGRGPRMTTHSEVRKVPRLPRQTRRLLYKSRQSSSWRIVPRHTGSSSAMPQPSIAISVGSPNGSNAPFAPSASPSPVLGAPAVPTSSPSRGSGSAPSPSPISTHSTCPT